LNERPVRPPGRLGTIRKLGTIRRRRRLDMFGMPGIFGHRQARLRGGGGALLQALKGKPAARQPENGGGGPGSIARRQGREGEDECTVEEPPPRPSRPPAEAYELLPPAVLLHGHEEPDAACPPSVDLQVPPVEFSAAADGDAPRAQKRL
jgi:hypothetical protein